jgi:AcrR family transcriptional regulator
MDFDLGNFAKIQGGGRFEQIIGKTTELFHKQGYEPTTMRDLAAHLGMKSGSLYNYINNKQELLFCIIMQVASEFIRSAEGVLKPDETAVDQMKALIRSHLRVLHENLQAVTVYYQEWRKLDEELRKKIISIREQYEEILKKVIKQGMDSGEFAVNDLNMTRIVVLSVMNWAYQWYQKGGSLSASDIADKFTEILFNGLLPR